MSKSGSNTVVSSRPLSESQVSDAKSALDLFKRGDYSNALNSFLKIASDTSNPTIFTSIADCYLKLGDSQNAKSFFKKAISKQTMSSLPYTGLGNLYYAEGEANKAILYWSIASTLVFDDSTLLYNLATAYSKKGLRIQAVAFYEKFLKRSKNRATSTYGRINNNLKELKALSNGLNTRGTEFYTAGNLKEAIACYSKSVNNYPLQPVVHKYLGDLFFALKSYEAAVDSWVNAFITSNFSASNYGYLPLAYEALGQSSYAYCYYYQFMNASRSRVISPQTVKSKMVSLAMSVFKDTDYSAVHLEKAKGYEEDNNYQYAFIEYANALILAKNNKKEIEASIARVYDFVCPEQRIISNFMNLIDRYTKERNYAQVIQVCDKILSMNSIDTSVRVDVRTKKEECQKLLS